jgi:hypothetical protein
MLPAGLLRRGAKSRSEADQHCNTQGIARGDRQSVPICIEDVEKERILDEFVATTGYHRKHAIRALRSDAPPAGPKPVRNLL